MGRLRGLSSGLLFALVLPLSAFGSETNIDEVADSNLVASIIKAPVSPDGTVSGRPTELVVTLNTSLDPRMPGRSLKEGKTIVVTLPDAFRPDGRPILNPCPDILTACNALVLLQGWPQNPIKGSKLSVSYGNTDNTIIITALSDIGPGPNPIQNPGIKQIHLMIRGFTNPRPGHYRIDVSAETGRDGALETGQGSVRIFARNQPNLNVVSATDDNPPPRRNRIYQHTGPGMLTPIPMDFSVWDRHGEPFLGIEVDPRRHDDDSDDGQQGGNGFLLVQGRRVVGDVRVDAPDGAHGQTVFTMEPSSPVNSPVTGFQTALLRLFFRAGSEMGDYVVTVKLNGGNTRQMFVRVN